jgi:16S rRNA processing protein RimM
LRELAIVGRVRRAHGLKGDLAVELYTGAPEAIFASGARVFMGTTTGPEPKALRECAVGSCSLFGKGILLHLEGVEDRDTADTLTDLMATRTSHRLELYIIALIGIEIALSLYDTFLK